MLLFCSPYICPSNPRLIVEVARPHTDRSTSQKKFGLLGLESKRCDVSYVCVCAAQLKSYVAISSIYTDIFQGWRTKAQIIALHGGDIKAAEEIISQKEGEGLVDHHPDSVHLKTYYATFPNE